MQRLRTLPHEKATGDVASMISSYHVVVHLQMGQLREEHGKKRLFCQIFSTVYYSLEFC